MSVRYLLPVLIGGGLGATLRYVISLLVKSNPGGFPWATFWINVGGCLFMGLAFALIAPESTGMRLFVMAGILGGFTTFSSFGLETFGLFEAGQYKPGILYVLLSNLCGLAAVYLGVRLPVWVKLIT